MAYDLNTQHGYVLPGGGRGESGYVSFCAGAQTTDVGTLLTSVYYSEAHAQGDSNLQNLYTKSVLTDGDISRGFITFRRETAKDDISQTVYYDLRGW